MQAEQLFTFGSYRLDPHTGQLWRGKQEVTLTPKVSALLRCLIDRAGQVVSKAELFQAVWPETVVSDAALTTCVQEVRQALHDNAKKPRYIETVHRRGYRWLALLRAASPVQSLHSAIRNPQSAIAMVGRESELTQLHGWLSKALNGERQIVFVTGEPGIGKTTLVEAFLQSLASGVQSQEEANQKAKSKKQKAKIETDPRPLTPVPQIGRGQCIEHYGVGEAYLPILEALGRLCREPGSERLIALLKQHAPSWLVQMSVLVSPAKLEELQRRTAGTTRERMLRELAEALEVIAAERPLILVLEDLHWSDVSTLDLLSMLARRQEPAQLLVIGTYRPVEVLTREHPLKGIKQELHLHGQCDELALDFLSEAAVGEYLARRIETEIETERKQDRPLAAVPSPQETIGMPQLARIIHRRTDGNPLFMVNLVDHLLSQGVLVQTDGQWVLKNEDLTATVPENLRQLIEQQIGRIRPEERKILEAASVAGAEFSAAAVAAGVETTVEAVEERCEELARRDQFLRPSRTTEWPDGTITARYSFLHALYQDVLYARLTARRQQRLHQQIGEREEQAYGNRAREIAAELAVHFERGRDYPKAIQYLQHAGENALRRSAHEEAINLLTKGLELLKTMPDTSERIQQELTLQIALNDALVTVKGYAAPEVENTVTRARALCQQLGETPQLFSVLWRLIVFYHNRGEFQTSRELSEQMMHVAQSAQDHYLLSLARMNLGITLFWGGELPPALTHLEQAIVLYDPQKHPRLTFNPSDPRVACLSYVAWALWELGYPDQALQRSREMLTLARELSHPFTLAYALGCAAQVHLLRRESQLAREQAEAVMTLSTEQGFRYWLALGTIVRGWALAEQGQVEEGIAQMRKTRAPYLLALLAEAYGKAGQVEEGLTVLAKALAQVEKTGERVYEAELYRIKGELTLQKEAGGWRLETSPASAQASSLKPQVSQAVEQEAEGYFLKAIAIAQRQQAKSLELRAVTSLSRLWQRQGKTKQAHTMLSEVYNWFTEGLDTKDLQEAKELLDELSH